MTGYTGIYSENGKVDYLRFKSALLRDNPENPSTCFAQFDALYLKESHGWWLFDKSDFVNIRKIGEEI